MKEWWMEFSSPFDLFRTSSRLRECLELLKVGLAPSSKLISLSKVLGGVWMF